jgi:hypothetical protein
LKHRLRRSSVYLACLSSRRLSPSKPFTGRLFSFLLPLTIIQAFEMELFLRLSSNLYVRLRRSSVYLACFSSRRLSPSKPFTGRLFSFLLPLTIIQAFEMELFLRLSSNFYVRLRRSSVYLACFSSRRLSPSKPCTGKLISFLKHRLRRGSVYFA